MRVVAGTHRGRRIEAPEDQRTRPTTDRVREAIFNSLTSLDALDDATVLDLYAGSGALGIEALSRGAAHVTFVEKDRAAADLTQRNLNALELSDRSTLVRGDASTFLANTKERFDLALLDPPYGSSDFDELLRLLPADLAVLESAEPPSVPEDWATLRQRRYSSTLVTIIRRLSAPE